MRQGTISIPLRRTISGEDIRRIASQTRAALPADGIHNPGVGAIERPRVLHPAGYYQTMPTCIDIPFGDLTPDQRRRQVAALLAQGVIRCRRAAQMAESGEFSPPCDTGLEVVSETRLSVSEGLARDPECEVNDGRTA